MLAQKLLASLANSRILGNASLVVSTFADAATITVPAGVQAGDLIVFWDAAADADKFDTPYTLAGWSRVINERNEDGNGSTGGVQQQQVFVKVATGTESGTVITGTNWKTITGARRKIIAVFRTSVGPISNAVFGGYTFAYSTGVPATQTVIPLSNYFPTITFGLFRGAAAFTATFSPSSDGTQNGGSTAAQLFWKFNNTSASNTTLSAPDSGALTYVGGFYLMLT